MYTGLLWRLTSTGGSFVTATRWLKATWGYDDFASEQMLCGTQLDDVTSCGVCAVNTIEGQVFGDRLWAEEFALAYQASKFVEVTHRVLHLNGSTAIIDPLNYLLNYGIGNTRPTLHRPPFQPPVSLPVLYDNFLDNVSSDAPEMSNSMP
ncbi:hypothetical protein OPQ81_006277 [Rhizoctonia solani]|nr:hypothetical protein OPQ81_006277 [Rhizoctonia solani]